MYRHVGQLILLVANIHTLRSDLFANSMAERQNKQLNETTINQLRTLLELIKLEITRIKSKKLSDTKKRAREDVNIFLGAKEGIVDLPKTNLFNKMKLIIARQVVALIGKVMSARDREQWSDYIVDKAITDEELFPEHAETIKKLDVMLRIIQNPELETKQLLQTLLYLLPGLDDYGVSNDFLANMFKFAQKETSS